MHHPFPASPVLLLRRFILHPHNQVKAPRQRIPHTHHVLHLSSRMVPRMFLVHLLLTMLLVLVLRLRIRDDMIEELTVGFR